MLDLSATVQDFRPVVVALVHDNGGPLPDQLNAIAELGLPIIAVTDGSGDDLNRWLAGWALDAPQLLTPAAADWAQLGKPVLIMPGPGGTPMLSRLNLKVPVRQMISHDCFSPVPTALPPW